MSLQRGWTTYLASAVDPQQRVMATVPIVFTLVNFLDVSITTHIMCMACVCHIYIYICYVSVVCLSCVCHVSVICLSYVCHMSVMCLLCVCRVQVCHRFLWMHAVNQISFMMSYVQQQANKIAQC